jgi:hypothetical protein
MDFRAVKNVDAIVGVAICTVGRSSSTMSFDLLSAIMHNSSFETALQNSGTGHDVPKIVIIAVKINTEQILSFLNCYKTFPALQCYADAVLGAAKWS